MQDFSHQQYQKFVMVFRLKYHFHSNSLNLEIPHIHIDVDINIIFPGVIILANPNTAIWKGQSLKEYRTLALFDPSTMGNANKNHPT